MKFRAFGWARVRIVEEVAEMLTLGLVPGHQAAVTMPFWKEFSRTLWSKIEKNTDKIAIQ